MATGYPVLDTLENLANDYAAQLSAATANGDTQAIAQNKANLTEIFKSLSNKQTQFESRIADAKANGDTELLAELRLKNNATIRLMNTVAAYVYTEPADPGSNTATDAVVEGSDRTGTTVPTGTTELTKEETNNIDAYNPNSWGSEGVPVVYNPKTRKSLLPTANRDDAKTITKIKTEVGSRNAINFATTENPLHAYSSYTYGLSLHLLKADEYNRLADNPTNIRISKTLISSAQRYKDSRDPAFQDDFYFDSLKFTTIIGNGNSNKASNNLDIAFTIIEPIGMSLLDRILNINTVELGNANYLAQPYMLEINFFGYDDNGVGKMLVDQTKFIPIKIIDCKIKANLRGSEYQIAAIPFNHQSQLMSTQATKATFEVTAGTVSEFFQNVNLSASEVTAINSSVTAKLADDARAEQIKSSNSKNKDVRTNKNNKTVANKIGVNSFTAAYNAWAETARSKGAVGYADTINFDIDPVIANAAIVNPKKNPVDRSADPTKTSSSSSANAARGNDKNIQSSTPVTGSDLSKSLFTINSGSRILDIIDMIIGNSSYIRDQLTTPSSKNPDPSEKSRSEAAEPKKKPTDLYKVIPKLKLKEFDKKRNTWATDITFYIRPYSINNVSVPTAPLADELPNAVKDYNFFYTGHNKDIIDFEIDFNALFFTAVAAVTTNTEVIDAGKAQDAVKTTKNTKVNSSNEPGNNIQPIQHQPQSIDVKQSALGTAYDSNKQLSQVTMKNIYSSSTDMLMLNLKILGDPDFIKQDDVLYNPGTVGYSPGTQFVNGKTGSLNMDAGELLCSVAFNSPADFDENTGLLRKDQYYQSKLGGKYSILTVESDFRQGRFTQSLKLIRKPVKGPATKTIVQDDATNSKNKDAKISQNSVKTLNINPAIAGKSFTPNTDEVVRKNPLLRTQESSLFTFNSGSAAETGPVNTSLQSILKSGETFSIGGYVPPTEQQNFLK
jgi:hypothetical protein